MSRPLPIRRIGYQSPERLAAKESTWILRHRFYGKLLRDHVTGEQLTRVEVCRRAKIHRETLHRWLQGEQIPSFTLGLRVADALRMDPHDLDRELRWMRAQPWRSLGHPNKPFAGRTTPYARLRWERGKKESEEFAAGLVGEEEN